MLNQIIKTIRQSIMFDPAFEWCPEWTRAEREKLADKTTHFDACSISIYNVREYEP